MVNISIVAQLRIYWSAWTQDWSLKLALTFLLLLLPHFHHHKLLDHIEVLTEHEILHVEKKSFFPLDPPPSQDSTNFALCIFPQTALLNINCFSIIFIDTLHFSCKFFFARFETEPVIYIKYDYSKMLVIKFSQWVLPSVNLICY